MKLRNKLVPLVASVAVCATAMPLALTSCGPETSDLIDVNGAYASKVDPFTFSEESETGQLTHEEALTLYVNKLATKSGEDLFKDDFYWARSYMNKFIYNGEYVDYEAQPLNPVIGPTKTEEAKLNIAPNLNLVLTTKNVGANADYEGGLADATVTETYYHNEKISNFSVDVYTIEIDGKEIIIPLVSFTREFEMSYLTDGAAIAMNNGKNIAQLSAQAANQNAAGTYIDVPIGEIEEGEYATVEAESTVTTSGKITYKNIPLKLTFNGDNPESYLPYYWVTSVDVIALYNLYDYEEDYDGSIEVSDYKIDTTTNLTYRSGTRTFNNVQDSGSITLDSWESFVQTKYMNKSIADDLLTFYMSHYMVHVDEKTSS